MKTEQPLWGRGQMVSPQHFQQQDRFFEATVRGSLQAGQLHTFGFRALTLDPALLEAGQVAVLSARGIFPDGTPFAIPETMDAPKPLAISADMGGGPVYAYANRGWFDDMPAVAWTTPSLGASACVRDPKPKPSAPARSSGECSR